MTRVVALKGKYGVVKNEIDCEPLTANLFLEFGKRQEENGIPVKEGYRYIALMQGDINYTRRSGAKQLYFTHFVGGKWRLLDDTCRKLVEEYDTVAEAIARLRDLANRLTKREPLGRAMQ